MIRKKLAIFVMVLAMAFTPLMAFAEGEDTGSAEGVVDKAPVMTPGHGSEVMPEEEKSHAMDPLTPEELEQKNKNENKTSNNSGENANVGSNQNGNANSAEGANSGSQQSNTNQAANAGNDAGQAAQSQQNSTNRIVWYCLGGVIILAAIIYILFRSRKKNK